MPQVFFFVLHVSDILNFALLQGTITPVSTRITCLLKGNVLPPTPPPPPKRTVNMCLPATYLFLSSNRFIWFVFHSVSYIFSFIRGCPALSFWLLSCFLGFVTRPLTDLKVWGEVLGLVLFRGDVLKTKRFKEAFSYFSFNCHKHCTWL